MLAPVTSFHSCAGRAALCSAPSRYGPVGVLYVYVCAAPHACPSCLWRVLERATLPMAGETQVLYGVAMWLGFWFAISRLAVRVGNESGSTKRACALLCCLGDQQAVRGVSGSSIRRPRHSQNHIQIHSSAAPCSGEAQLILAHHRLPRIETQKHKSALGGYAVIEYTPIVCR